MYSITNPEEFPRAIYQAIQALYVLTDDSDRRVLKPFGLTIPQFNALIHLELENAQYLSEISDRLLCDRGNMTRIVDRLERDGLVQRVPDGNDRRYVQVTLTTRGEEIRRAVMDQHRASLIRRLNALSEGELTTLNTLMDKLLRGLQAYLDTFDQPPSEPGARG